MTTSPGQPTPPTTPPTGRPPRRLVCLGNGIYTTHLGGGDIYFAHMARAAIEAGVRLHFFGGHAFKHYLETQGLPANLTLTDRRIASLGDVSTLSGQFRLLFDYVRRFWGTLKQLRRIEPDDVVYAMSDYWFDSIPLLLCRARCKIMYLGMMAPTLKQVITRGRADVTASRLASVYYWASQQFSLRTFRWRRPKRVTYSHPEMRAYLQRLGYADSELVYVPNGMDVEAADQVPAQTKAFDLAWTGRVHAQKGIDDLIMALQALAARVEDFRAVIIGKSKDVLEPRVVSMGLARHVTFTGLVSETEKFRLLKASRVFAMPSRYESWGIVIGEALAGAVPVVAYDLACYRPVFGEFVRYVEPFDQGAFVDALERTIREMRSGRNYLETLPLEGLKHSLSWKAGQKSFCDLIVSSLIAGNFTDSP